MKDEIESLLLAAGCQPYHEFSSGREQAGFLVLPRTDGTCGVYYRHTKERTLLEFLLRARDEALQRYRYALEEAGVTIQYVEESYGYGRGAHIPPWLWCSEYKKPAFVWYEYDRNDAYNQASDDTRAYIEKLEEIACAALAYIQKQDGERLSTLKEVLRQVDYLRKE